MTFCALNAAFALACAAFGGAVVASAKSGASSASARGRDGTRRRERANEVRMGRRRRDDGAIGRCGRSGGGRATSREGRAMRGTIGVGGGVRMGDETTRGRADKRLTGDARDDCDAQATSEAKAVKGKKGKK